MYRDNLNVSLTLEDMDNLTLHRYAEEELSEKWKTYAHMEWHKRCIRICILFVLLGISCALKEDLRHICIVIIAAFLFWCILREYVSYANGRVAKRKYYFEIEVAAKCPVETETVCTVDNGGEIFNFYPVIGVDTTSGYKSRFYIDEEKYESAKPGSRLRIPAEVGGKKMKNIRNIVKKIDELRKNKYIRVSVKLLIMALVFTDVVLPIYGNIMDNVKKLVLAGDVDGILQFVEAFFLLCILFFFIKDCVKISMGYWDKETYYHLEPEGSATLLKTPEIASEVKAAHEAGHWLMVELLGIKVKEVSIITGRTTMEDCIVNISDRTSVSTCVKIFYAGLTGEQILIGETGNGCMGGKNADLERAEDLIKRHILLTDEVELTPTCISQETVERVAAMSKQIRQEVMSDLTEHKDELKEKYEQLLEKREIILSLS